MFSQHPLLRIIIFRWLKGSLKIKLTADLTPERYTSKRPFMDRAWRYVALCWKNRHRISADLLWFTCELLKNSMQVNFIQRERGDSPCYRNVIRSTSIGTGGADLTACHCEGCLLSWAGTFFLTVILFRTSIRSTFINISGDHKPWVIPCWQHAKDSFVSELAYWDTSPVIFLSV